MNQPPPSKQPPHENSLQNNANHHGGILHKYISVAAIIVRFALLTAGGWATLLVAALVYLTLYADAPAVWMGLLALVVQACTSSEFLLFSVRMGGGARPLYHPDGKREFVFASQNA